MVYEVLVLPDDQLGFRDLFDDDRDVLLDEAKPQIVLDLAVVERVGLENTPLTRELVVRGQAPDLALPIFKDDETAVDGILVEVLISVLLNQTVLNLNRLLPQTFQSETVLLEILNSNVLFNPIENCERLGKFVNLAGIFVVHSFYIADDFLA